MKAANKALPATGAMCAEKPLLEPLAFALLDDIRAYFQDPENEKAYRQWLEARDQQKGA